MCEITTVNDSSSIHILSPDPRYVVLNHHRFKMAVVRFRFSERNRDRRAFPRMRSQEEIDHHADLYTQRLLDLEILRYIPPIEN